MLIEIHFPIKNLCKEYSFDEIMKIAFENFDYISNLIYSNNLIQSNDTNLIQTTSTKYNYFVIESCKKLNLSKSNNYNIYVSYQQNEDGEMGTFIYNITDRQCSNVVIEKLFIQNENYRKEFVKLFITKLQFKPETEIIMFCSNGGWYEYNTTELV